MNKHRNLFAVGLLLITTIPLSALAEDDKTDFCQFVASIVSTAALRRDGNLPVEDTKENLSANITKYLPNISVYRVNYLMQLVDAVYKEPKAVSGKKLAENAENGCLVAAYDKIVNLERNR